MTHLIHTIHHGPALPKSVILTRQAERWAQHVLTASGQEPAYVWRKALAAARFSAELEATSLAVPSKLYDTSQRQEALATLAELKPIKGHRLGTTSEGGRLLVSFADVILGEVQWKHARWLRPLLQHGASVHLLAVTGTGSPEKYLGCNVAFAFVSEAVWRSQRDTGGDGLDAEAQAPDVEPVRLWRDERGEACMNIRHTCRHSPSGIEWGYVGSGPSDVAYSVLRYVAGAEVATEHSHQFLHQVISRVPWEGAVLHPEAVREWLRRQGER